MSRDHEVSPLVRALSSTGATARSLAADRLHGARVVIIEDHVLLAQSLRLALAAEGANVVVLPLTDGATLVAECMVHKPHVVFLVLDLGESTGPGDALIGPLAQSGVRVVVLTGSTDKSRLGGCLEAGAVGLLEKTTELELLVDNVRLAVTGERMMPAQRRLDLLLESRRVRVQRRAALADFESLTEREAEVLAGLMHGVTVDEIADRLYVSTATVRTHVRAILRKLGVRSQLAAVARARIAGWTCSPAGTWTS